MTLENLEIINPKWLNSDHTMIEFTYEHPTLGQIPFTVIENDTDDVGSYVWSIKDTLEIEEYQEPEIDLEELKQEKLNELSSCTQSTLDNAYVLSSLGFKADANNDAVRNIEGLITLGSDDITFCDYDNIIHEHITAEQIKVLQREILLNGQNLYAQKWAYRSAINNAESVEDLNLTFNFEMLDFQGS